MPVLPSTLYPILLLLTAADAGAADPAATCPPPFVVGGLLERSLAAGRAEVVFELEADRYIRLTVEQGAVDVKVTVIGPAGGIVVERDGPGTHSELASWTSNEPGEYRLVVESAGEGKPQEASASIRCEEHRPTRPDDADRVAAELALSSAIQLDESGQQLDRALGFAQEAADLWKGLNQPDQELEARLRIGFLHLALRQWEKATASLLEVLTLARAEGNGRVEARALRSLAFYFYTVVGDSESALRHASEALLKAKEVGEPELTANVLEMIGLCQIRLERNQHALAAFREALALAPPAEQIEARLWNHLGMVQSRLGESGAALVSHDRARQVATKKNYLGPKAVALTSLGQLRSRRGELQEALSSLSEALAVTQQQKDREGEAVVLNHLGVVMLDLGEPRKALDHFTAALATGSMPAARQALTQINIAHTRMSLGEPELALDLLRGVLATETGNPRLRALALRSRGASYRKLNRSVDALHSLAEALTLFRDAGDRLGEAATLLESGWELRVSGRPEEARQRLTEALRVARLIDAWPIQASSLHALALVDRDRGEMEQARQQVEEALGILRTVRSTLPGDRLRTSFVASKRAIDDFYIHLLMQLNVTTAAFEASEAARGRSLLDLLAEGRGNVTRGISEELKALERDLHGRLAEVQLDLSDALGAKAPDPARIKELRNRLDDVIASHDRLKLRIRRENPRYAEVRYPLPLRLNEIRDKLPPDTALIEYWLGAEGSYVFAATREETTASMLPSRAEIAHHVESFSRGVKDPDPRNPSSYISAARWLYNALVSPVASTINRKRHLVIAPDGALHAVAFEALLTHDPSSLDYRHLPYLVQDFAISYVPSASVLSWLKSDAQDGRGLRFVAFANPIPHGPGLGGQAQRGAERSGLPALAGLPPLEGSGSEVDQIAKLYPASEVKLFLREAANQRNVAGVEVAGAKRIHFAVHGFLDNERPEFSGLALTQTPDQGDDGLLQVFEIFNLDLSAQLVVLSACDTGGTEVAGEGLVGLARAFLYAGAPSVVASLWRVRDDAAPILMIRFYQALDKEGSAAEALREAKRALISGEFSQPYFWAPFIVVGKSR